MFEEISFKFSKKRLCFFIVLTLFISLENKLFAEQETHWPFYDQCQSMPEQPFYLEEDNLQTQEFDFCFSCEKRDVKFVSLKKTTELVTKAEFKEKLRKRVIGKIESQIFEIQLFKACIREDKKWFLNLAKDNEMSLSQKNWPELQEACRKKHANLKTSIQKNYQEMIVHLSLTSPSAEEGRILPHRHTWFKASPSHLIPGFAKLPLLSKEQKQTAEKIYIEELSKISLEGFDSEEFKQRLLKGKSLKNWFAFYPQGKGQGLTPTDTSKLLKATKELREKSENRYYEIIHKNPLLAYLKTNKPDKGMLLVAFNKQKKNFETLLKEVKNSDIDLSSLLVFSPLVEELLEESPKYCLAVEKARIHAEKNKELKDKVLFAGMFLALVPCFMSGGASLSVCLGLEAVVSLTDLKMADKAAKNSLVRSQLGKEFEKLANLKDKQKELKLAKIFIPLLLLEAGAVAKGVKGLKKKIKEKNNKANTKRAL